MGLCMTQVQILYRTGCALLCTIALRKGINLHILPATMGNESGKLDEYIHYSTICIFI